MTEDEWRANFEAAGAIWRYQPGGPHAAYLAAYLGQALGAPVISLDLRSEAFTARIPAKTEPIVFADDLHSGRSAKRLIKSLVQLGLGVRQVLTLANFGSATHLSGRPIQALFRHRPERFAPESCPLCQMGSRAIAARQNWNLLRGEP